jgi:hypothetical protein
MPKQDKLARLDFGWVKSLAHKVFSKIEVFFIGQKITKKCVFLNLKILILSFYNKKNIFGANF